MPRSPKQRRQQDGNIFNDPEKRLRFFIDFDDDDTSPPAVSSSTAGSAPVGTTPVGPSDAELEAYWKPKIEVAVNSNVSKLGQSTPYYKFEDKLIKLVVKPASSAREADAVLTELITGDSISALLADDINSAVDTSLDSVSILPTFLDKAQMKATFVRYINDKFGATPTMTIEGTMKTALEKVLLNINVYKALDNLATSKSIGITYDGGFYKNDGRHKVRRSDGRKPRRSDGRRRRSDGKRGKRKYPKSPK